MPYAKLTLDPSNAGTQMWVGTAVNYIHDAVVGGAGRGIFTQDGAGVEFTADLILGQASSGYGEYDLHTYSMPDGTQQGGGLLVMRDEVIGVNGRGLFDQLSGNNRIGGYLILGQHAQTVDGQVQKSLGEY